MFPVTDPKVAAQLNAGACTELHYKEYLHTLPWRGVSRFVVISVRSKATHAQPSLKITI